MNGTRHKKPAIVGKSTSRKCYVDVCQGPHWLYYDWLSLCAQASNDIQKNTYSSVQLHTYVWVDDHFCILLKHWLAVSTPLKHISQNGNLPQIGLKMKNIWNHHPRTVLSGSTMLLLCMLSSKLHSITTRITAGDFNPIETYYIVIW